MPNETDTPAPLFIRILVMLVAFAVVVMGVQALLLMFVLSGGQIYLLMFGERVQGEVISIETVVVTTSRMDKFPPQRGKTRRYTDVRLLADDSVIRIDPGIFDFSYVRPGDRVEILRWGPRGPHLMHTLGSFYVELILRTVGCLLFGIPAILLIREGWRRAMRMFFPKRRRRRISEAEYAKLWPE